jgi:four helix bundle protein
MARGSCLEVVASIQLTKELKYMENKEYNELYEEAEILSKMLSALKKSIK